MSDQPIIQQIIDNLKPILNTPGSEYYLPTYVAKNGYDPYGPVGWDIGQLQDPGYINALSPICGDVWIAETPCSNPNDKYIASPTPPNYPVLSLTNVTVTGLSNAVAKSLTSSGPDGMTITAVVDFSTLSNYPPAMVVSGNFSLTQYCSCSADGKTPSGNPQAETGTGTFSSTIGSSSAQVVFQITNLAPDVLTLAVTSISLIVPNAPNSNPPAPDMKISINITSIPVGQGRTSYNNLADEAFNGASAMTAILAQLTNMLSKTSTLDFVANALTKELDGYLRNNHMYPFNGAFLTLF